MPVARIIGAAVAITLLGVSLSSGLACRTRHRELTEWQVARPMSVEIDLSKPGEFDTRFRQTCAVSHGEIVLLDVAPPVAFDEDVNELFQGLVAVMTVFDAFGEVVLKEPIKAAQLQDGGDKPSLVLTRFYPFPIGDYTARISVESGAAGLAQRRQTLYAQYQLCGLEGFPMLIAGIVSFISFIPGLITAVVVTRGFAKYGWSLPPQARQPQVTSSDGSTK